MNEQLHIIITSDRGKIFRLPCSKKKLKLIAAVSLITFLLLGTTSFFSLSLYTKNRDMYSRLSDLQEKLNESTQLIAEHKKLNEAQRLKLDLKVANLKLSNLEQAAAFRDEKETLISEAVSELTDRSELMENIIDSIGIKLPEKDTDNRNKGGIFIEQPDSERDELIYRADKYLKAISYLPFGDPVDGTITSRFGKRIDPVNGKKAFHSGVDIRANKGDKIYATADGVVRKALKNGGHGNYVLIDHGNGYTTSFSHMQAFLVKKGERVSRGQLIGLVGDTGRSTGAHLHYQINLDDKPLNPYQFMKVAGLDVSKKLTPEIK